MERGNEITLLDGKTWDRGELILKMYDDPFYYGYLGRVALSSSSMKKLLTSIDDYKDSIKEKTKEEQEAESNKKPLLMGRLSHVSLLEPQKLNDLFDFADCGNRNAVIYKELKKSSSKQVVLEKDRLWAKEMEKAVRGHSIASKLFSEGNPEVPMIDYIGGIPVRGKADWLRDNSIVDYKTTSNIDDFEYNCTMFGYDIQAYLYTELFKRDKFIFVAVDKKTFKVRVVQASAEMIAEGKKKVEQATETYVKEYF